MVREEKAGQPGEGLDPATRTASIPPGLKRCQDPDTPAGGPRPRYVRCFFFSAAGNSTLLRINR